MVSNARQSELKYLAVLEQGFGEFRLADDAQKGSLANRVVERNGNRNSGSVSSLLHDEMAATLASCKEAMLRENLADLGA